MLTVCDRPGCQNRATARHHPDIENRPNRVECLCTDCHVAADRVLGKNWLGNQPDGRELREVDGLPVGSLAAKFRQRKKNA